MKSNPSFPKVYGATSYDKHRPSRQASRLAGVVTTSAAEGLPFPSSFFSLLALYKTTSVRRPLMKSYTTSCLLSPYRCHSHTWDSPDRCEVTMASAPSVRQPCCYQMFVL
jgi:hypothetical protein